MVWMTQGCEGMETGKKMYILPLAPRVALDVYFHALLSVPAALAQDGGGKQTETNGNGGAAPQKAWGPNYADPQLQWATSLI